LIRALSVNLQKLLNNTSSKEALWMTAEQFISLALSFFVGVTVIRYLGPDATGALNYAGAIGGLLGPLASLGLEAIVVRELAKSGDHHPETWQTVRKLLWAVTALNILIIGGLAVTQPSESLQQIALWATAVSGLSNLTSVHLWAFRAATRYREIARIRLFQMVVIQLIRLAMVYLAAPFIAFAAIVALDPLILSFITQWLAKAKLTETIREGRASKNRAKELLAESWPIILTCFGIMIYTRIDVVMLQQLSGIRDVGIYGAASRLSELWNVVPMILVRAAYPRLVELVEVNPVRYTVIYRSFFLLIVGIPLLVACCVQVGADYIVLILYKDQFAASADPLRIHIWSAVPVFIGSLVGTSYQIFRVSKPLMWGCIAGSVSNVVLNFLWIPTHGPNGAAAATAVSYALSVITPLVFSPTCRLIAMGHSLPDQK
jgi:polysaccharide transporter, PST family